MGNKKLRLMTFTSIFTALVFLATRFFAFPGPIPPGYINLGDSLIMVCAVLAGSKSGAFAGAFGSALADVFYPGGIIFAPFTFVVKGLEGYIIGKMANKESNVSIIIAIIVGALVMVGGYFLAEWFVLPLIDKVFGITYALAELPLNFVQGGINAGIGITLSLLLKKNKNLQIINQ